MSILTGPTCFLLQVKLIWLGVVSFNYWLYDFNDTRFQFFFFLDILYYWLLLILLSRYPIFLHIIKKFC